MEHLKIKSMQEGRCKTCPHLHKCLGEIVALNKELSGRLCHFPEGDQDKYKVYQTIADGREFLARAADILKSKTMQ